MVSLQLAILTALFVQAVAEVPRLGAFARGLSAQEIADIERDALPAGLKAWLLVGPVGQIGGSVATYLPPETSTGELRRGPMMIVRRQQGESRWSVFRNESWAQVALADRSFDTIQGEQDLNRPFPVSGNFDDAELLSLVRFLRSGPGTVERDWPVESLSRQPDNSIRVYLRSTGSLLQRVVLKKEGTAWAIVSADKGRA